jgi:hypothetical protein
MESEKYASPIAEVRRVMIRMSFNELKKELKEGIQNNSTNPKRIQVINLGRHRNL